MSSGQFKQRDQSEIDAERARLRAEDEATRQRLSTINVENLACPGRIDWDARTVGAHESTGWALHNGQGEICRHCGGVYVTAETLDEVKKEWLGK